ncbi:hypothetical protein QBC39DRAFT_344676 [Podospora conica]|nr:hypothetical protein QBC39DRAFT_344676 [Schizothecium conicum]
MESFRGCACRTLRRSLSPAILVTIWGLAPVLASASWRWRAPFPLADPCPACRTRLEECRRAGSRRFARTMADDKCAIPPQGGGPLPKRLFWFLCGCGMSVHAILTLAIVGSNRSSLFCTKKNRQRRCPASVLNVECEWQLPFVCRCPGRAKPSWARQAPCTCWSHSRQPPCPPSCRTFDKKEAERVLSSYNALHRR